MLAKMFIVASPLEAERVREGLNSAIRGGRDRLHDGVRLALVGLGELFGHLPERSGARLVPGAALCGGNQPSRYQSGQTVAHDGVAAA